MTYKVICTPVRRWKAALRVAIPTLDSFGPMGRTSTRVKRVVHRAKAARSPADRIPRARRFFGVNCFMKKPPFGFEDASRA
jgi:hypothetical protein